MRLLDEEIKSAVEYERETMGIAGKKNLSTIKEEDEFNFSNSRSMNSSDRSRGQGSGSGTQPFSEQEQNVLDQNCNQLIGNENVYSCRLQKGLFCQT